MTNLYAACRVTDQLQIKRVRLTQQVQAKIEGVFEGQAATFLDGIDEEVAFAGDWKPDPDEVLFIDAPPEAVALAAAASADPMTLPDINAANFIGEGIKALFVTSQSGGTTRVLIQLFSAQQILARRFALMLDGNTFKELTEPAFTLDNYLTAIIEDGKLKFKSFHNIKRLFQLSQFYQEASDQEIDTFCGHTSLHVADAAVFKAVAGQAIRKMVHAITKANILDQYSAQEIVQSAAALGLHITMQDGALLVPSEKRDIKTLFRFLDDGIYSAPLTKVRYMTNSKRPFA